jgi:predicted RNA-binding Zn-ribbon protein involved in translation (DUF1610 family)
VTAEASTAARTENCAARRHREALRQTVQPGRVVEVAMNYGCPHCGKSLRWRYLSARRSVGTRSWLEASSVLACRFCGGGLLVNAHPRENLMLWPILPLGFVWSLAGAAPSVRGLSIPLALLVLVGWLVVLLRAGPTPKSWPRYIAAG